MLLKDIIKTYSPPYPFDDRGVFWEDTFTYVNNDPMESKIVESLIKEFLINGDFREPIILPESDEEQVIQNGIHRIVALVNMEEWDHDVKTQIGYSDSSSETMVEFFATIDGDEPEESAYQLGSLSYPLDRSTWIECDGLAIERKDSRIDVSLYVVVGSEGTPYVEKVIESVTHKIESFGGVFRRADVV